jgi:Flp pilus assembly protein TadD
MMDTHSAEKWFEYARQQVRQNNNTGAIESLRRALSLDPDFSEAHALLSLVLLDQRRIYAAKHEAQLALALSPESPVSRLAEAQVLVAQRQFKQAETFCGNYWRWIHRIQFIIACWQQYFH